MFVYIKQVFPKLCHSLKCIIFEYFWVTSSSHKNKGSTNLSLYHM